MHRKKKYEIFFSTIEQDPEAHRKGKRCLLAARLDSTFSHTPSPFSHISHFSHTKRGAWILQVVEEVPLRDSVHCLFS